MTDTTITPAPRVGTSASRPSRAGIPENAGALVAGWLGGAVALLALSTGIVLWARTRPGFDPYGWLVWGHQALHFTLDTNAAPSWKPLPFLFTFFYALAGSREFWLWMITAAAVSLAGVVFAARISYRLTLREGRGNRYAAAAAALFAAVGLLEFSDYAHYVLSSQSDPMIVSLCLAAIDCHLCRRYRWALIAGGLAALGRPEVWPFLALYGIWCWRAHAELRAWVAGVAVLVLFLWFGIPGLTSRTPFVAASNAMGSGRRLQHNQVFGTIGRFVGINQRPLEAVALLSAAYALWRRDWVIVGLALGVAAWVVIEVAFALHGWPGLARYMWEAAGVTVVIAAVGVGRLVALTPSVSRAAGIVGAIIAVALLAALVPTAISRARSERSDLRMQRDRTAQINHLSGTIRQLGGAVALRRCGEPLTRLEYQTALAYALGDNVSSVGFKYSQAFAHGNPVVFFTPDAHGGWIVRAAHQTVAACRALPQTHSAPL